MAVFFVMLLVAFIMVRYNEDQRVNNAFNYQTQGILIDKRSSYIYAMNEMNGWNENQSVERVIMQMDEMVFKVRYSMWKIALAVNSMREMWV